MKKEVKTTLRFKLTVRTFGSINVNQVCDNFHLLPDPCSKSV